MADGTQNIAMEALRAMGRGRLTICSALSGYGVVGIPLASCLGKYDEFGVVGVWIGVDVDGMSARDPAYRLLRSLRPLSGLTRAALKWQGLPVCHPATRRTRHPPSAPPSLVILIDNAT